MAIQITRRDIMKGIAIGAGTGLYVPIDLRAQGEPAMVPEAEK